jgi:alkanesulfonate monooxygenase SsuD/methylene tetrahydromethanopterin reductase-like flavin-dependent oxidoreductase (luciferase family)
VPIWLAALGYRGVRVAGELADGWLPFCLPSDRVHAIGDGLKSERLHPLTVAAGPIALADDDPTAARHVVASMAAWYVTAMGDVYRRSLLKNGYAAEVAAVRAANPRPRLTGGVVPPEAERLLGDLAAYGTCRQVRERLEGWDDAADITTVTCPPGVPWHMLERTLYAAAPDVGLPSAK